MALSFGADRPTHRAPRAGRTLRLVLATAFVAAAGMSSLVVPGPATAEGSRDFYPDSATCGSAGSCRANIEWRTDTYGPSGSTILRRTLFTVFAKQGEVLEMGSSAVGAGNGDVVVWNPGQVRDDQAATLPSVTSGIDGYKCSQQRIDDGSTTAGTIATRAQEQAGPQSVTGLNPTGYVPCHYQAPSTGLYKVAFYGPAGAKDATDGSPTGDLNLASTGNFDSTQGTSIAAWDLTVRKDDTSTADLSGRLFTYALAGSTGAAGRPIDEVLYATTLDGYVYKVDTNGVDPDGFVTFGNEQGRAAPPRFPLSFEPLSDDTLAQLRIDAAPAAPALSNLTFAGAAAGGKAYAGRGGTFTFSQNLPGSYQIVISRDGTDFDPANPQNRVLQGDVAAGEHTVAWDGTDDAGHAFPAGSYAVRAEARAGAYALSFLDGGSSTTGTPTVRLLAPSAAEPSVSDTTGATGRDVSTYVPSATDTTSLDVVAVPAAATGDAGTVVAGHVLSVPATDGVLANDTGTSLRVTDHTDPAHGTLSIDPDGSYTYSPDAGWSGHDSFGYTVSDAGGHSATATVTVHVQPRAYDDTGSTTVGHAVTLHPLANDVGSSLVLTSVSRVSINAPAFVGPGRAEVHGSSVVYTPARGVSGVFRFTYVVRDAAGQKTHAVDTVTVAPRAADDSDWTPNGTPVLLAPLRNDLASGAHLVSVTDPAHGTAVALGDQLMFAPDYGYVGTTTFRYTLRDGAGQHSTATVSVRIKATDAEVKPDELSTDPGKPITFDPTVNDPGRGSFEHSSLVLIDGRAHRSVRTLVTPAGTFTVAARTGVVTFAPAHGFVGRVWNVTYLVADRSGRLHRSTIMVHIGDQAGAPGRNVSTGLKPGRELVNGTGTGTGTGTGLKPGRVIKGELPSTGNPVSPLLPLVGAALVGLGILLVRRRPSR